MGVGEGKKGDKERKEGFQRTGTGGKSLRKENENRRQSLDSLSIGLKGLTCL